MLGVVALVDDRPRVLDRSGLEQQPGRLPVVVADDAAAHRVGGVVVDAHLVERASVHPHGVEVGRVEVGRHVGHDRVEHLARRDRTGDGREQPAQTQHAGGARMLLAPGDQLGRDVVERRAGAELCLEQRVAGHQEVGVAVDEAGRHHARRLDHGRVGRGEPPRLGGVADVGDALALGEDRLGPRPVGVGREHATHHEDGGNVVCAHRCISRSAPAGTRRRRLRTPWPTGTRSGRRRCARRSACRSERGCPPARSAPTARGSDWRC